MREIILRLSLLVGLALFPGGILLRAQSQEPRRADPPGAGESSSRKPGQPDQTTDDADTTSKASPQPDSKPSGDKSAKPGAEAKYDPFPAVHDVDVGTYYLHKGDTDAAIDRFLDAIQLRPTWAEPRLLVAQAYEKKGDKASALKYYKEYLQVFPTSPNAKKIQKKIEKLEQE
ncbi:MAG TPA: tetratricopeptide repeat protein [Candidatus Sulfotelmatobacter sp.]|nr:tetratricopeptide repeat protein [Candidatus Sulfotelmatobacter sp.]